jgi:UPF0716 family protein affecting phage T7 exclusion
MRLLALAALMVIVIDIVSDAMFVIYQGWAIALAEVLASALFGLVIVVYVLSYYRSAYLRSPSPKTQWHGILLLTAAAMLILPGVASDAIGLLLLLPRVRRRLFHKVRQ